MARSNSFFNMDMLILCVLKKEDCYGYELVKRIFDISDGSFTIKEGTLYPILYNLLKKEYISCTEEVFNRKVRVYYHIEEAGINYLNQIITKFKKNMEGVFKIIDYSDGCKKEK